MEHSFILNQKDLKKEFRTKDPDLHALVKVDDTTSRISITPFVSFTKLLFSNPNCKEIKYSKIRVRVRELRQKYGLVFHTSGKNILKNHVALCGLLSILKEKTLKYKQTLKFSEVLLSVYYSCSFDSTHFQIIPNISWCEPQISRYLAFTNNKERGKNLMDIWMLGDFSDKTRKKFHKQILIETRRIIRIEEVTF